MPVDAANPRPPANRTAPSTESRRARAAVAVLFFTNGAIFANLLPRYPGIKTDLSLSNTAYGLAIAAFPAGALVAGLFAGMLIRRFRSSRAAVIGTVLTGTGVLLAGLAGGWAPLAAALLLAGASDAITDVAQNAHGLRVQRRYGRSILNSFHAVWSVGAVTGGLMGAAAVGIDLPRPLHLGASAALLACVALAAYRFLLPGPEPTAEDERGESNQPNEAGRASGAGEAGGAGGHATAGRVAARSGARLTALTLLALVLISISGIVVEDAGGSWAAVYLSGSLGAAAAIASSGYVALVGAQCVGRFLGDRLVDRFGERAVARAGGLITAVGMGVALAVPTVPTTVAGFAAAGFGVATLIPGAMHVSEQLPGFQRGTGLAILSWGMRVGFLAAPPVVGMVSDATSLRTGLLVVPLAGVAVLALSAVFPGRQAHS